MGLLYDLFGTKEGARLSSEEVYQKFARSIHRNEVELCLSNFDLHGTPITREMVDAITRNYEDLLLQGESDALIRACDDYIDDMEVYYEEK